MQENSGNLPKKYRLDLPDKCQHLALKPTYQRQGLKNGSHRAKVGER
jgi:hypothetical protein